MYYPETLLKEVTMEEKWYNEPVSLTLQNKAECLAQPQEHRLLLVMAARKTSSGDLEVYANRDWQVVDTWEIIGIGNTDVHFATILNDVWEAKRNI
jgi:hypothetical protein